MPLVDVKRLEKVCFELFQKTGVPEREAKIVADHLVRANLNGHDSHGVIRLLPYIESVEKGITKPGAKLDFVKETPATALLNGNWGFGQVLSREGMKIAIQKAEKLGLGSVAIFNCTHIGFLADYSMMALKHNMIGVTAANSSGNRVVPFGGRSGVIDTNPICFAIPTGNENPIVLDMATSVVANGKIRVAYARGKRVPEGWIIDAEGNPTTDPADWVGPPIGSTLPLGGVVGYKGFGLGIVMDVLGGALTGFGCGKEFASKYGEGRSMNGVFMLAIKISAYTDLDDFKGHVDRLIRSIRDSPRAPGADEILLPGEPELRSTEKRLREGIYVEEDTWNKISGLAKNLGIDLKDI